MGMSGQVQPDEAAGALADIRQRQGRVIDAVLVPHWYWWAVAAGMVAIGAAADTRRAPVLAVVIPVAAAVIAILTGAMSCSVIAAPWPSSASWAWRWD
jgi:hypothetical protein